MDLDKIHMFFYWAKLKPPYGTLTVHFDVYLSKVGNMLRDVLMTLDARHRPFHVGVSHDHPITLDDIENKFSTYMAVELGKRYFGSFVAFNSDGTYPRSRGFGGNFGRQELRSWKKCRVSKVSNSFSQLHGN